MKTELYTIRTLTNLHAGSGEINFDIIDNQVQRDYQSQLPTIHSSSLKGALREHFRDNKRATDYIFGPEAGATDRPQQTGAYTFFEANLLSRPLRSNRRPCYHGTSIEILRTLLEKLEDFGVPMSNEDIAALKALAGIDFDTNDAVVFENAQGLKVEDVKPVQATLNADTLQRLEKYLGKNIVLFRESKTLSEIPLPVMARNQLDSGESKNLWYEEVVPRRSRFYFILGKPDNLDSKDAEELEKMEGRFLESIVDNQVQIGASASIGYGYTRIERVAP